MNTERFEMPIYCAIILRKGNQVLLMQRSESVILGGYQAFPGGGVDGSETITGATIRESYEELGIVVQEKDLKFIHVLHVRSKFDKEYIAFFFQADHWTGEPAVMEPEKCDVLAWFDIGNLPEDIVYSHKQAIDMMEQNKQFSEFGWI